MSRLNRQPIFECPHFIWWALSYLILATACVSFPPSRSYEQDLVNYEAASEFTTERLKGKTFSVEANQPWQNSEVHVSSGNHIKILAMGKWSQAPAFNVWSGPEGLPGTGKEVPWINANALMGKIGQKGKPFEVGPNTELRATGEGDLYFSINDPFNWVKDNSGSMQVTVFKQSGKQTLPNNPSPLTGQPHVTKRTINEDPRFALIIGNSHYEIGALKNPQHDAQDIAKALKNQGFGVSLHLDSTQAQMEAAISEFGRKLYQGGVGLFYYAGHGVQVDGENYLIPVGSRIEGASDVRYKAVNVGQIIGKMGEARNGLNIVILDACRDNPFSRGFRSSTRGLAVVNSAAAKGTLIAYATSPGKVASDGDTRNGLYTKHLLKNMQTPGLPVEQVFKRVLRGVEQETNGKQSPWTSSSFSGDFYFVQH